MTKRHGRYLPEWAAVLLLGGLYCAIFLSVDTGLTLTGGASDLRLQGLEHERLSGILIPVQMGLGWTPRTPGIGHLPAWNPYLGTGTPLLNNAFYYLFNPFMSLPMLLLGAVQGGKVAIMLGVLLAGFNMWLLARAIGLGAVARVTVAVLYLASGGIMGKLQAGHFQLGLSLTWLPLVLAGLWWTLTTTNRRAPVLMALAFALMFFSGNIYYTLHTLVCGLVITLFHLAQPGRWPRLRRVLIGGLLALGLTMIQFWPVWVTRDYVQHPTVDFNGETGQLSEQHDLGLSLAHLVVPWEAWQRFTIPPTTHDAAVSYSYVGPITALFMIGLALPSRHRRTAMLALILVLLLLLWGAGQTIVVNGLYRHIRAIASNLSEELP